MSDTSNPPIYIRHCDPNSTGEGLGSHMRRTLYPLLQVALHFGWEVIWEYDQQPCWKDNEYRKSYSHECLELGLWLGFATKYSDLDRDRTISVPLNIDGNDPRFGNLRGAPEIINFVVEEYISQHGLDKFVGCNDSNRSDPVLITLFGRFEYQDDPTPSVLEWMNRRCREWKSQTIPKLENDIVHENRTGFNKESRRTIVERGGPRNLSIVCHIRVPEELCTQEWKDANSISHVVDTLEKVWDELSVYWEDGDDKERRTTTIQVNVFTEESFTRSMEDELVESLSKIGILLPHDTKTTPNSTVCFQIHRQTPLLPCVQAMAVADLFIPASSYLSSMAAFFHTSLIVLPNEATRHDPYFATHLKYQTKYCSEEPRDKPSCYSCPIVRVEKEEELKVAIQKFWQSL